MEKLAPIAAVKKYFEFGEARKVTVQELKALSAEERIELAKIAIVELNRLGVESELVQ